MTDQRIRAQERSATSPEELAELYEARWRSGEWVERQIEVGPCGGVPRGEDDGGGIIEAIECQDGEIECRACDGEGQTPVCLNEWDEDESAPCEECSGTCMETCPTCNGSGVLTIPGRELAAYCGDGACRYLLGQAICCGPELACDPPCTDEAISSFADGLDRFGAEAVVRVGIAAARACLAALDEPPWPIGLQAIGALTAWLANPCEETEWRCRAIPRDYQNRWVWWDWPLGIVEHGVSPEGIVPGLCDAADVAGEPAIRRAIQDALIPWALNVEEAPEGAEEQTS